MNEIMKNMSTIQKVVYIAALALVVIGTYILVGWLADSEIETKYKLAIYALIFGITISHVFEMQQLKKKK